jgi:hypothetical protein
MAELGELVAGCADHEPIQRTQDAQLIPEQFHLFAQFVRSGG